MDYLALLHGIVKRHATAEENRKEGKEVIELHPEVLIQVRELLVKLANVPKEQVYPDQQIVTL